MTSGRVVVLSPHLDDAVLSLGATIAHLAHRGHDVRVLTVFGGNPDSRADSGASNRRAGFPTVGTAAAARRREDLQACTRLGARARWLHFDDDEGIARDVDEIALALRAVTEDADVVLVPAYPLAHPDHRLVAEAADQLADLVPLRGYVEQPYAAWERVSRKGIRTVRPAAARTRSCVRCRVRKWRAAGSYRSQLRVLRRLPRLRVAVDELLAGGERLVRPTRSGLSDAG